MKIIIGLGNPGPKYQNTRHNSGFICLNKLTKELNTSFNLKKKFNAEIAQTSINNEKTLLVKPQTFMNNSGQAIQSLISFYKLNPKDITVIYDDIDLPLGEYRTTGQSSGGHKGMQSIIDNLNTKNIKRIRIGILGLPKEKIKDTSNYVLQKLSKEELKKLNKTIDEIINKII